MINMLMKKKSFIFIFGTIILIIVTWLVSVSVLQEEDLISNYKIVSYDDISVYEAYRVDGTKYIDPVYIPMEFKGLAIMLDDVTYNEFIEMHFVALNKYKLTFLKKTNIVDKQIISISNNGTLVSQISEKVSQEGYDCILIEGISGKLFGVEYIKSIKEYSDNVVYKSIEDTNIEFAFSKQSNSLSLPFEVTGVQAYNNGYYDEEFHLEVLNIHTMNITLLNIVNDNDEILYEFSKNEKLLEKTNTVKYENFVLESVDPKEFEQSDDIYLNYNIGVSKNIVKTKIHEFPRFNDELYEETQIRTTDNLSEFDFIKITNNRVSFVGDNIVIDKPLFIPAEYSLLISKGQTIDIVNEAYIVSRNAILSMGTELEPISFITSDNSGRGVFVCQAEKLSTLNHTIFDGFNSPESGAWLLTSAVTFYESNANFINCQFINNQCEDALNIVRSNFTLENCLFENTFSDAFDSDFSEGEIKNCTFRNTGNDGIDVSTSKVDITDVEFILIGDKAISGGEKSTLEIENIDITDVNIGVASKDSSIININNITINNAEIAIILYQKKDEFEGGYLEINNLELIGDIGLDYLIQEGSILFIDGEEIIPKSYGKEEILFDKIINGEEIT